MSFRARYPTSPRRAPRPAWRPGLMLAAALAAAPACPAQVAARTPQHELSEADRLAQEATRRFKQQQFLVAAGLFEKAYELDHRPTYLFNLARCYEEAGRLAEALTAFDRYIAVTDDPVGREDARVRVGLLEKRQAALAPRPEPARTADKSVVVTGKIVQPQPLTVRVAGSASSPAPSNTLAYVTGGAGLALGVAGLVAYLGGVSRASDLQARLDTQDTHGRVTGISRQDATQESNAIATQETLGAVLGGIGLVATGVGTALLVLHHSDEHAAWNLDMTPSGAVATVKF